MKWSVRWRSIIKKASYDVVNYLIGLGHRNIGIITGSLQYASGNRNRLDGYKEALSDAGIPVREDLIEVCDDFSDKKAENLTKKLLYNPAKITALVTFNDIIAVASYRAAKEMKKKYRSRNLSIRSGLMTTELRLTLLRR